MVRLLGSLVSRPVRIPATSLTCTPCTPIIQLAPWRRLVRYQAFDAAFDPDELAEARRWRQGFNESSIPKGDTTFTRSSGPGGQHVNKSVVSTVSSFLPIYVPDLLQDRDQGNHNLGSIRITAGFAKVDASSLAIIQVLCQGERQCLFRRADDT